MELLAIDAVTADLRLHEARQSYINTKHAQMVDYICAQVISAEFSCKPQHISDFWDGDDDFRNEICDVISRIVRDPRNMMNLNRLVTAFDHAIERKAEAEWNEWRAA